MALSDPSPMTIKQAILEAQASFQRAGLAEAALDARRLMQAVLDVERARLISIENEAINRDDLERYGSMCARRLTHEPVHRIIGSRLFYGRPFRLNAETLEPRPDTEILVDAVLSLSDTLPHETVFLDFGSGSGCIAVTLLAENPKWLGHASDISALALEAVEQNAVLNGIDARLQIVHSDGFQAISRTFDLIVSNPPYIPSDDIAGLSREVRDHDPMTALDGGDDGLEFYRLLLYEGGTYLAENGLLVMEFGIGQADQISALANRSNWQVQSIIADLSGVERVIVLKKSRKP